MNKIDLKNPQYKENEGFLKKLIAMEELFWINPHWDTFLKSKYNTPFSQKDVKEAEDRVIRFAPYIKKAFPETKASNGIIKSPLVRIPAMKDILEKDFQQSIFGDLLLKCDSHLPISGSIKARGGIYEILKHAENLAFEHHLLKTEDDYSIIDSAPFYQLFSQYSIAVGSTGNLGLSIGIISAKLGFQVTVHMSADAKEWKKDLLRSKNVKVIEYDADYSKAVEEGRRQAESDPACYFVDDENSLNLFLGYALAASELQKQLENLKITIDEEHPLFVYLPCGVGGGPGGITFGLKLIFHDHVHCFFAEPTHSPCVLLGLMTGLHDKISVQDVGIDNITAADGLAVGRASGFVGKTIEPFLNGGYTINDDQLFILLKELSDAENIKLEPSALAGMYGPIQLFKNGKEYLKTNNLTSKIKNSTHIIWGTGGSMVPNDIMLSYYQKGLDIKKGSKM